MKKISLFFDSYVREQMDASQSFGVENPGLLKAITFPSELIRIVLQGGLSDDFARKYCENEWEVFGFAQPRFMRIQKAVLEAYRIESTLFLLAKPSVCIEMRLYRKGEKKPFNGFDFYLNLKNGELITSVT